MFLLATSSKLKFYRRAILAVSLVLLAIFSLTASWRLTYDLQPQASIIGKHNYLLNLWNRTPQETGLTPYRSLYQQLTPTNQKLLRSFSRQLALISQGVEKQALLQILHNNEQKIMAALGKQQQALFKQLLTREAASLQDPTYLTLKAQLATFIPEKLGLEPLPAARSFATLNYPLAYLNWYFGELITNQYYRGWQGIKAQAQDKFLQQHQFLPADSIDLDALDTEEEIALFNQYPKLGVVFYTHNPTVTESRKSLVEAFNAQQVFRNLADQPPYLTPSYRVLYQKLNSESEMNETVQVIGSNLPEDYQPFFSSELLSSLELLLISQPKLSRRDFFGLAGLEKYFYSNSLGTDLREQGELTKLSPSFTQGSLGIAYCGKIASLDFAEKSSPCLAQAATQAKLELSQLLQQEAETYVILPFPLTEKVEGYDFTLVKYATANSQAEFISLLPSTSLGQQLAYQLYALENKGLIAQLPSSQKLIKYVVGLPGDTIEIYPDGLYLNGIYLRNVPNSLQTKLTQSGRKLILNADQYWLMGDNPQSIDSLYFGPITSKQLLGKAVLSW